MSATQNPIRTHSAQRRTMDRDRPKTDKRLLHNNLASCRLTFACDILLVRLLTVTLRIRFPTTQLHAHMHTHYTHPSGISHDTLFVIECALATLSPFILWHHSCCPELLARRLRQCHFGFVFMFSAFASSSSFFLILIQFHVRFHSFISNFWVI